jgi:fructose/tagatose bisphosphate aldolase
VKLSPEILGQAQAYIKEKTGSTEDKPVFFVFHGGSGSEKVESLCFHVLSNGANKARQIDLP